VTAQDDLTAQHLRSMADERETMAKDDEKFAEQNADFLGGTWYAREDSANRPGSTGSQLRQPGTWLDSIFPKLDARDALKLREMLDAMWNYLPEETDEEDWQPSREEFLALLGFIAGHAGQPALWLQMGEWARKKAE